MKHKGMAAALLVALAVLIGGCGKSAGTPSQAAGVANSNSAAASGQKADATGIAPVGAVAPGPVKAEAGAGTSVTSSQEAQQIRSDVQQTLNGIERDLQSVGPGTVVDPNSAANGF